MTDDVSVLDEELLERAVAAAPSVLNTRPWLPAVHDDVVELRADPSRRLQVIDPAGRELVISCGAALLNLRLALLHCGREPMVEPFPDPEEPTLLARVDAGKRRQPTAEQERLYAAIPRRHTDRRPFREERLPFGVMARLEEAAAAEGAVLGALTRQELPAVLELAQRAGQRYRDDPDLQTELAQWVGDRATGEERGIRVGELGPRPRDPLAPVRDFDPGQRLPERATAGYEQATNLAILSTFYDTPADWLRAGQATQRVLLLATDLGLATSFLTHPLELADLRAWIRDPSLVTGHPQVILRLGHPAENLPSPG